MVWVVCDRFSSFWSKKARVPPVKDRPPILWFYAGLGGIGWYWVVLGGLENLLKIVDFLDFLDDFLVDFLLSFHPSKTSFSLTFLSSATSLGTLNCCLSPAERGNDESSSIFLSNFPFLT